MDNTLDNLYKAVVSVNHAITNAKDNINQKIKELNFGSLLNKINKIQSTNSIVQNSVSIVTTNHYINHIQGGNTDKSKAEASKKEGLSDFFDKLSKVLSNVNSVASKTKDLGNLHRKLNGDDSKDAPKRHLKKDGTPDRRFKENKNLKADGTPDKRIKGNKNLDSLEPKKSTADAWKGVLGAIGSTSAALGDLTGQQEIFGGIQTAITIGTELWTLAQTTLNVAFWTSPITWIVAGIIALIAAIAYVAYSTTGWGEAWDHTVKGAGLLWEGFVASGRELWESLVNNIMIGINRVQKGWYEFKNALGIGDETENNAAIAKIDADTKKREKVITDAKAETKRLGGEAIAEFKKAAGSVHSNGKDFGTLFTDIKKKFGFGEDATKEKGTNGGKIKNSPGGSGSNRIKNVSTNTAAIGTNESIAAGGTKNTQISIDFKDLIGVLNINANSFKEGVKSMEEQITDALVRVLGSAQATAG